MTLLTIALLLLQVDLYQAHQTQHTSLINELEQNSRTPNILWEFCNLADLTKQDSNLINYPCNNYVNLNDSLFNVSNDYNYLINVLAKLDSRNSEYYTLHRFSLSNNEV